MCGRARCSLAPEDVAKNARVEGDRWRDREKYRPSYNVGPGRWLPIVKHAADGGRELQTMKWGLVPSFTQKGSLPDHFRMFNARSETIVEKPVFNRLLSSKRCVVVVNGFYEWHGDGQQKQPFYVSLGNAEDVMMFAGLYDCWEGGDGDSLHTFAIVTTDSSKRLSWLHGRMPVVLRTLDAIDEWLDPSFGAAFLSKLCAPYNGRDLAWHPVTHSIGKLGFDGPECCKDTRKKGIGSFFKHKVSMASGAEEKGQKESMPATRELQSKLSSLKTENVGKVETSSSTKLAKQSLSDGLDQVREEASQKGPPVKPEQEIMEGVEDAPQAGVSNREEVEAGKGAHAQGQTSKRGRDNAGMLRAVPKTPPSSPVSPSSKRQRGSNNMTITSFFSRR
eukprot:evm.model.scf_1254.4 EVM.evm.TU.scf_1254.4   scf_1254:23227-27444(+)